MAVFSATLLAAGVLRHYVDIYQHQTVRGISFIFVGIDAAGDLFSLVSLSFQPTLDVAGMSTYAVELALWIGVFACGGYFNLIPWARRTMKERSESRESHAGDAGVSEGQIVAGIGLHDLPSSTSVFRTPSNVVSRMPASDGR